jgi:hypothetical protein
LFEKGEETGRLPALYDDGTKVSGGRMRRVDIVKGFGLDERFAKTAAEADGGGNAAAAAEAKAAAVGAPKGNAAKKKD